VRHMWTDGSGQSGGEGSSLLKTAWATLEFELQKSEQVERMWIKPICSWKHARPNLESAPRCEARAILKAVQLAQEGQTVHIHTDSKVTVQQIRVLAQSGDYQKKRCTSNEGLMQEVLEIVDGRGLLLILEWVKGHETMASSRHNWVSRTKQMGHKMVAVVGWMAAGLEVRDRHVCSIYSM